MVGHDQKPRATTTGGHWPPGPAGCGIAVPSGVCAAAMMLLTSLGALAAGAVAEVAPAVVAALGALAAPPLVVALGGAPASAAAATTGCALTGRPWRRAWRASASVWGSTMPSEAEPLFAPFSPPQPIPSANKASPLAIDQACIDFISDSLQVSRAACAVRLVMIDRRASRVPRHTVARKDGLVSLTNSPRVNAWRESAAGRG
jgi:hypothetical protein